MRLSYNGLDFIQRWEGFSPYVYRCPAGLLTIGYGHVLQPGERFERGIDAPMGRYLLEKDVALAEAAMARLIAVELLQHQWDALVSFTFNVGAGRLQMSSLRRAINRGAHEDVPRQLMRWVYAGSRKLPGLVKRRAAEAALYANNETAG